MLDGAARDFNFAGLSERDPLTRNKNIRVPVVGAHFNQQFSCDPDWEFCFRDLRFIVDLLVTGLSLSLMSS